MKDKKRIKLGFRMDIDAFVTDEALLKDDKAAVRYIKQLIKKFFQAPRVRNSFYLESFVGLFSGCCLFDTIKEAFKIKEDEREHFFPLARECDEEVRDFILGLFKPGKVKIKEHNNLIPIDIDRENQAEFEGRDLLYDQFSPLEVNGLCFWEDSPDGIVVETRLIPNRGWQWTASTPDKGIGIGKNCRPEKRTFSKDTDEGELTLSFLQNSVYYFLQMVYIFLDKKARGYRLIVFHHGHLKLDRLYKTERGAKIGFGKIYNRKLWKKGLKPEWTHYYPPEDNFIVETASTHIAARKEEKR